MLMDLLYPPPPSKSQQPSSSKSLSDLPDSVIDDILHRLPTIDAIRSGVLSRAYHNRWRSIPDIKFHGEFNLNKIDNILRNYSVPIRSFSCKPSPVIFVYHWIRCLIASHKHSLSSFDLVTLPCPAHTYLHFSSLFLFRNLKFLSIKNCLLTELPPDSSFPCLQMLCLNLVYFRRNTCLPGLISGCPDLVSLTLDKVRPPPRLHITNSNLRHFSFRGECEGVITFAAAQIMEKVSVFFDRGCSGLDLLQSFPAGAACNGTLCLVGTSMMGLVRPCIPESIPDHFWELSALKVQVDWAKKNQIMYMYCLLSSMPNLEKLMLYFDRKNLDVVGDDYGLRLDNPFFKQQNTVQLDMLKYVVMDFCSLSGFDICFLKFVLERASLLEKLTIVTTPGKLDKSKRKILEKCPRASAQAIITWKGKYYQEDMIKWM